MQRAEDWRSMVFTEPGESLRISGIGIKWEKLVEEKVKRSSINLEQLS